MPFSLDKRLKRECDLFSSDMAPVKQTHQSDEHPIVPLRQKLQQTPIAFKKEKKQCEV